MWYADGPMGFESRKIKYLLPRYTRGRVLEIGCGLERAFPHFIGIDKSPGAANLNMSGTNLALFADNSVDSVFSSHMLEDTEEPFKVLLEWWRVIKPGGYLVLYLPHKDYYPNIGEKGANPAHKHDFLPEDIRALMTEVTLESGYPFRLLEDETRSEGVEYSFFQVYQKIIGYDNEYPKKPEKTCLVFRIGGIGDILQCANVLPALKEKGYYIFFETHPVGENLLRGNPYIDEFIIWDKGQIPDHELHCYYNIQSERYDLWVNLQHSVEGTLLASLMQPEYHWNREVRHKAMNVNYAERIAEIAGVPFSVNQLFYPTEDEKKKVQRRRGDGFHVMWVLAGSSCHKFTPHMDEVIKKSLEMFPDMQIVFVGDSKAKKLEVGWEDHPRVRCLSGKIGIRETLTLATVMDLVIGPETGVLNAVGHDKDVAKICLLSHSTEENLTKHWLNTQTLVPTGPDCYPCHKIHYGSPHCNIDDETGAALCTMSIGPERIIEAIGETYGRKISSDPCASRYSDDPFPFYHDGGAYIPVNPHQEREVVQGEQRPI